MNLSEERLTKFWEEYGEKLVDWEYYPKKLIYYFKLWSYNNEDVCSDAIVSGEPSECTTGSE